ncbi:bifunctional [glutamine synthetase] adenylyltransferase/[glutamine synthetase]-adenylyl-L-tyrosine phosphorylase [Fodinicola acaciae]|uniref:bifunctional [glutamine synthetase] adenylyltransferase/[glutamine synthetase]-adenylyl-L-tyrosine phosphorylase n=1 Tax=Fodinicola acaciae TaxID=2681555 RepID=UPI0013D85D3A|nr:bifunctional [glutamine synthetase] adenylyltransferase/[glutamine synthetase]-adenylyl-L-tyrosine phosphorylase [Fodinicola acaciae]
MTRPRGAVRLTRYGLLQTDRATDLLTGDPLSFWDIDKAAPLDETAAGILAELGAVGDPDLALLSLHRLAAADPQVVSELRGDRGLRRRLLGVLGASAAFGDLLAARPELWRELTDPGAYAHRPDHGELRQALLAAVGAKDGESIRNGCAMAGVTGPAAVLALRQEYQRRLLCLAARDITGASGLDVVTAELADLADALLQAALAVATATLAPGRPEARMAVIAMGKCGGRELNYVSDVDVLFVAEPVDADTDPAAALRTATTLASSMMRICQQAAWPVDAALRPEGKDGPLVRTLASHRAYYEKWARTWEFQALIKARPAAGDLALGREWWDMVSPLVWRAADADGVVADVRAMRRKVLDHLPPGDAAKEVKLGPGGLRDIEFAVQLLQLVHGRSDPEIRSGNTLEALAKLRDGGYVGLADGAALGDAYRFLRTVEHRLQLQRLRRTHRIPDDSDGVRWLARTLGITGSAEKGPVEAFLDQWAQVARQVRRLHEKLFYRPLLEAVARVPSEAYRLSPDAARSRLGVLGFADPASALRHVEALTSGVSRTAAIQRTLLPAMLYTFADSPNPDAGLLAYRKVSELLGRTPWYLRLLRDSGPVAERTAQLLGASRYVADLLSRDPEALQLLADDAELAPRGLDTLLTAMLAAADRSTEPVAAVTAVRTLRRRELLRIACADLLQLLDVREVGQALSDVADAVLEATLRAAIRGVTTERGAPPPVRVAIVALGRLGGQEIGYASDADVLFVHEPVGGAGDAEAAAAAIAVAERVQRLLAARSVDPPLTVDAGLRPEGRQGPLSRSLASYEAYYRRWSSVWEAQALLRARVAAGDPEIGERLLWIADDLRYPENGLDPAGVTEIRRLKARVDSERLPRGADPALHTKLGRGGLGDVEWTIQLVQMQHARQVPAPGLRSTSTLDALEAAAEAGLISRHCAADMVEAWKLASRVRNALMLVRGRPSDQLPRYGADLAGVAWVIERETEDPQAFVDRYLRTARHARRAVEDIFGA